MIKRLGMFVAMAGLLLAAAAQAGETSLKEFKWEAGKCTVLMPGTPKELPPNKGVGPNGMTVETHMVLLDAGKHVYLLAYTANADLLKASDELKKKALDDGRDAAVRNIKGKLTSEKDVKVAGEPGREIQIEAPGLGIYRARLVIIGDRLYQLVVAGPEEIARSKDADKFLDSFKVTK